MRTRQYSTLAKKGEDNAPKYRNQERPDFDVLDGYLREKDGCIANKNVDPKK